MKNYSEDADRLYHIQVAKGEVGRYVILPGDPKRCAKIAKYFDDPVLIADNREYITYTGTIDEEKVSVTSTGIGGPSASIAMEELYRCGADTFVYHTGVVQCKDSFYGQHEPEIKPVSYELLNKWEAWKRLGCLASEMESAAMFVVASCLKVRIGSCFLVLANQEREKLGLDNPVVHDTDMAVQVAVEAVRNLIHSDREKRR